MKPGVNPSAKPSHPPRSPRAKAVDDVGPCRAHLLSVLWIYWPALRGTWLWDDDYLLQHSDIVHDPDGLWNIWFTPGSLVDYYPITVSLEWLEWEFWPDQPLCYHLTSVILHMGNALLVWHLFRKPRYPAGVARRSVLCHSSGHGRVGGVDGGNQKHALDGALPPRPLRVDGLRPLPQYRTLSAHARPVSRRHALQADHVDVPRPHAPVCVVETRPRDLARPRLEPALLRHLRRHEPARHRLRAARRGRGNHPARRHSLAPGLRGDVDRLLFLALLPARYAGAHLSAMADQPTATVAIHAVADVFHRRPLALEQAHAVGPQRSVRVRLLRRQPRALRRLPRRFLHAFAWTMDHFLYLPMLGLLALVVAAVGDLATKLGETSRRYGIVGIALVAVVFTVGSREYAKTFASSEAQWTHEIETYPNAWPAHNNLGNAYADQGRTAEAGEQYREALAINPGYPEAHNNLGIVYARLGNEQKAIEEFQLALHYCPELQSAQQNLARVQEYQRLHPSGK